MENQQNKKTRNSAVRKQMAECIVEGYKKGATLTELAKVHKCSASTISNILSDFGVKARRRGPNKNKELDNGAIEQVMQPNAV